MLRLVDFKFPKLAVSINTESGDIIHIVHWVEHKMKEFVDFNSTNSVKSQCMGKYSIVNRINKKLLDHITTCLQSNVWGWALRWTGGIYIHISSKLGMGLSKIVGRSTARYSTRKAYSVIIRSLIGLKICYVQYCFLELCYCHIYNIYYYYSLFIKWLLLPLYFIHLKHYSMKWLLLQMLY